MVGHSTLLKTVFYVCCSLSAFAAGGCGRPDVPSPAETSTQKNETPPAPVALDYHIRDEFEQRTDWGHWPNLTGPYFNSSSPAEALGAPPLESSRKIWEVVVGTGYSTPVVGQEHIFVFHRQADEEIVDCRSLSNGKVRWQFRFPTAYECPVEYSNGPYSTPALDAECVYALGTEAKFYCLNRSDGELKWIRDLQLDYEPEAWDFPVGSSPLVIDGRVYLNLGGSKGDSCIVALDAESGDTIWTALNDGRSYATPRLVTIHDQKHLIVFTDRYIWSLDPEKGSVRWQVEFGVKKSPARVNAVSPLVVEDMIVVTAGPGGGVLCLQILPDGSQRELWTDRRALDSQFNNIVGVSDAVYGFTSKWNRQAQLRCLSIQSGEILWEYASDLMRGSMIAADGKLYLLGEDGHFGVVAINSSGPNVLLEPGEPVLKSPCYSAPVIAGTTLILRDEEKMQAWNISAQSSSEAE
ncbi:PQQ-binding-like beta-propeller repeat protein [Rubinisphaera margarita]|uniref:PQQ-binding-like beta-propeller repeat protein n=1 Tax=Rubinisphaera margarita TaxID=2909586 RepID=UPI001EE8880A|nr:PQQ-binding-like beta-propeller repeat protein [Rubinisphaera margarita]